MDADNSQNFLKVSKHITNLTEKKSFHIDMKNKLMLLKENMMKNDFFKWLNFVNNKSTIKNKLNIHYNFINCDHSSILIVPGSKRTSWDTTRTVNH